MDILGNHKCRRLITRQYEGSDKKKTIEEEINTTRLVAWLVFSAEVLHGTDTYLHAHSFSHMHYCYISSASVSAVQCSKDSVLWVHH